MPQTLTDKIVENMIKQRCRHCDGDGYTDEHNPEDPHENGCSNCPIQVQCEDCHAEGYYVTLDCLRTAIDKVIGEQVKQPKQVEYLINSPMIEDGKFYDGVDLDTKKPKYITERQYLDRKGFEGWELVQVFRNSMSYDIKEYYFKRNINPPKPADDGK